MLNIEDLRRYNVDNGPIEDLVALLAGGELILAKFEGIEVEPPDWLPLKIKAIKREIRAKYSDQLEQKLAKAKLQIENLKTPQEKKAALSAEIRRLEKMVAVEA